MISAMASSIFSLSLSTVLGFRLPKTALGNLLNQRVQLLDFVELLPLLPIRGQNRITIFTVDQCGEDGRHFLAQSGNFTGAGGVNNGQGIRNPSSFPGVDTNTVASIGNALTYFGKLDGDFKFDFAVAAAATDTLAERTKLSGGGKLRLR